MNQNFNGRLSGVLYQCKETANRGFAVARKNSQAINSVVARHRRKLVDWLNSSESGEEVSENVKNLARQLRNSLSLIDRICRMADEELIKNKENLADFTIVIYGKTMTGKSTFMETLLNGDGGSIGKGTQRTTLDIRSYRWNGLQIYDTPGIAASAEGGREDERKAYEIAKEADMIVFMLTDDNISDEEAKAFANIKKMGKPVLVLLNIKYDLNSGRSPKLMMKQLKQAMERGRIEASEREFKNHIQCQNVGWIGTKFIGTHLQAAYLARKNRDLGAGISAYELAQLSNFKNVENAIISEIVENGNFYQYKVFVDIVYREVADVLKKFLQTKDNFEPAVQVLTNNRGTLVRTRKDFERYGLNEIDSLIAGIKRSLESKKADFVDRHYEDKNAGEVWTRVVETENIEWKIRSLFRDLVEEYKERVEQFQKKIYSEINASYNLSGLNDNICGEDITDWKLGYDFLSTLATGWLIFLGPWGWSAAVIIWLFGGIFDSKEEKICKAKAKMNEQLQKSIDEIEKKLMDNIHQAFNDNFRKNGFDKLQIHFNKMRNSFKYLCQYEEGLIVDLEQQLNTMNMQVFSEACKWACVPQLVNYVLKVERQIGKNFDVVLKDYYYISDENLLSLEKLLQEKVNFRNEIC